MPVLRTPYEQALYEMVKGTGTPTEAALSPSRRGSPLEALLQLARWAGLAIPGRGGLGPLPPFIRRLPKMEGPVQQAGQPTAGKVGPLYVPQANVERLINMNPYDRVKLARGVGASELGRHYPAHPAGWPDKIPLRNREELGRWAWTTQGQREAIFETLLDYLAYSSRQ